MAFSLLNHSLKLNKPYPKSLARSEVTKTLQRYTVRQQKAENSIDTCVEGLPYDKSCCRFICK